MATFLFPSFWPILVKIFEKYFVTMKIIHTYNIFRKKFSKNYMEKPAFKFGHFNKIGHIWPIFRYFSKFFLFNQFFVPKCIHLLNFTFTAHVEVAFLKLATFINLAIFGQNLVNFRKKIFRVVFVLTRDTAYKSSNIKTNGKCDFSCPP